MVHQFLPKYVGGTEVYVAGLSRALVERGHEVALFTGGDAAATFDWEGMPVTQVVGGTRGPQGPAAAFMSTFRNPDTERAFIDTLDAFRPDIVHFQHLLGLSGRLPTIARERGTRTCFTLHDYWFMCPKSQLINHRGDPCGGSNGVNCSLCAADRLGSMAYAVATLPLAPLFLRRAGAVHKAIAQADLLLAPSDFLMRVAKQNGLPSDKLIRIEFGTELSALTRTPRAPGEPLRITYLGSLEQSKGVHVLVEAVRLLTQSLGERQRVGLPHASPLPEGKGIQLTIAGSLSAYPDYARQVQQSGMGLPITFVNAVSRDAIPDLLAHTDVLVVPSVWYENSPLVVTEAFAAGVPVVASRIGALEEKVRDGVDGLLFAPGNAQSLAAALQRVVDDPALLDRLQRGIEPPVKRGEHIDLMEQLYRQLLPGKTAAVTA